MRRWYAATVLVLCVGCQPAAPADAPTATAVPAQPTATVPPTATAPAPTATPPPTETPEPSTQYLLTFEATWSAATHPVDFPPNPHFSGLIGASHGPVARLWVVGEAATPGIRAMAETGAKSPLDGEIDALIADGTACTTISGDGVNPSPGTVAVTLTVSLDCPAISVVSMIAPSPDWFVGVSALSLLEDDTWIEQESIELFPYDAGTDSGVSYASADQPTEPAGPVHGIDTEPLLVDGAVPPLGTFTLVRLDE
jgi:hypothetical protein